MKYSYTILLSTVFGGGVLAKNSKLNQYASIADCQADANIISHASPPEGTCHRKDDRTGAVYLVVGDGAGGAYFIARTEGDCKGDTIGGHLATGSCITPPDGTKGFGFGF